MKIIPSRQKLVFWAISLELSLVTAYYIFSPHGLWAELSYQKRAVTLQAEIEEFHAKIDILERKIDNWKRYPWYHEKAAREQLDLCYPGEEIYLLPKTTQ